MIKKISYGNSNCYLVHQNDSFLLIDTELPGKSDELIKNLEENGVTKDNFKLVILTHGHVDHVGNALALRERFGVKIGISGIDAEMVKSSDTTFPKAHKVFLKIIRFILSKKNAKLTYKAFQPDILLKDGSSLEQYGFEAKVVALPGHTLGSIGILSQGDLFVGDAAMVMKSKLVAPIFGDSMEKMENSIKKINSIDYEKIYTGH